MLLSTLNIDRNQTVSEIVNNDYRTAEVFKKYNIGYCCGGKFPLYIACENNHVDVEQIVKELQRATAVVNHSNTLTYQDWPLDFLADYIVNVHHQYLRVALPQAEGLVTGFAEGHRNKFTYLDELQTIVNRMGKQSLSHMEQEEKVVFPYIRQVQHAFHHNEPYAGLFVKTLRKPIEDIISQEHETTGKDLLRIRHLTDNYTPPNGACLTHRVTFSKLREIDSDLARHIFLENEVLFPRVVEMEQKLTGIKNSL